MILCLCCSARRAMVRDRSMPTPYGLLSWPAPWEPLAAGETPSTIFVFSTFESPNLITQPGRSLVFLFFNRFLHFPAQADQLGAAVGPSGRSLRRLADM